MAKQGVTGIHRGMHLRQAEKFFADGYYIDAHRICIDLLKSKPNDAEVLSMLASITWEQRQFDEAFRLARKLIKLSPRDPIPYLRMGGFLNKRGRHEEALEQFGIALRQSPNHPMAVAGIAAAYDLQGERERALEVLEPYTRAGRVIPEMGRLYCRLQYDAKEYQEAIEVAKKCLEHEGVPKSIRRDLWFVIGQSYERLGQFDESFNAYQSAHDEDRLPFDFAKLLERYDETKSFFTKETLARIPCSNNSSRLPVFICCRPRSGSTLLERIIGSHPQAHTAGERTAVSKLASEVGFSIGSTLLYPHSVLDMHQADADQLSEQFVGDLQSLGPQALRITDKSMGIWERLAILSKLFPNAVFIDLHRNPIDNCFAIYTSNLVNFPWLEDLHNIGTIHRRYMEMMDYWHEVLDVPILRVNYEDIVTEPEAWSRKIIEHCGLVWDDRCLKFHEKEATRSSTAVPTLSYQQVRQPIYKSSVGRAQNFAKYFGPLYEALKMENPGA